MYEQQHFAPEGDSGERSGARAGRRTGADRGLRLAFGTALALALATRLWIICQPADWILQSWASDDLFYFTTVAHQIVSGNGATFDGQQPTNGFQQFWLALHLPFAHWFGDWTVALRTTLLLVSGTTVVLAFLLRRLLRVACPSELGELAGVAGASLVLLHPRILHMTFQGTEAVLALCFWTAGLIAWLEPERRHADLRLGLLGGLGCLVRIDHLALFGLIALARRGPCGRLHLRPARSLLTVVSPCILLLLLWAAVNWSAAGRPWPDSGSAKRVHAQRMLETCSQQAQPNEAAANRLPCGLTMRAEASRWALSTFWRVGGRPAPATPLVFLLAAVVLALVPATRQRVVVAARQVATAIGPLALASGVLAASYIVWLIYPRGHHLAPLFLLQTTLAAALFGALGLSWKPALRAAALLLWPLSALALYSLDPPRSEMQEIVDALEQTPDTCRRFGAFNSGLLGALLQSEPERSAINLDGVVNHRAAEAIRRGDLGPLVGEVDCLLDYGTSLSAYSDSTGGWLQKRFEPLALPGAGVVELWRRRTVLE